MELITGLGFKRGKAMKCGRTITVFLWFSILWLQDPLCIAEIYKYQDQSGKVSFTSDPNTIPEGARVIKVYKTEPEETDDSPQTDSQGTASSSEQANVRVLETLLQLYHVTHTYSKGDFFMCADMALDVWNMVKTKGMNSRIAIGNIREPKAGWREFNHAWVVAEISSGKWLALEATGGRIKEPGEENRNYYRGYFFSTPREFKEYLDLRKQAKELAHKTKALQDQLKTVKDQYDQEIKKYQDLEKQYDEQCANKRLPKYQFQKCLDLRDQASKQAITVKELEGRGKQLVGIIEANLKELDTIERTLDQPARTIGLS